MIISFTLNGQSVSLETAADRRVVDLLREDLKLGGTKECCGSGECGACTILVDGQSQLSCLMLAAQLQGRSIITIEGAAAEADAAPRSRSLAPLVARHRQHTLRRQRIHSTRSSSADRASSRRPPRPAS